MSNMPAEGVLWRLSDLYLGPEDPQLAADKTWCQDGAKRFADTYRGKVGTLSPEQLRDAVRELETLLERCHRLLAFGYLHFATRTNDAAASALWQDVQVFYSHIQRDTLFFELEWTQIEEPASQAVLAGSVLEGYRHHLTSLRRYKPHLLSEAEERVLAEKEPAGASAWTTLFDKVLGALRFGPGLRAESEVLSDLYQEDREVRRQAAEDLTGGLESVLHILNHIFNTILLDKAIVDRLRHYPHWLRARNLSNEADDAMVNALIAAVTSRYDLVQRYYRLKRRLLGYETLHDYDRYAPLPGLPKHEVSWEEAKRIVLEAYAAFSPEMAGIAGRFFDEGWIHAPIQPGKRSGAFSHPTVPSSHPYVLLNFNGTHRDVMTLAHELGHGVHQVLAAKQGFYNASTPLTTAETASVFGEMLVFSHVIQTTKTPTEKTALLCSKLEDIFATVFRQVSMNRFEDSLHTARRERGELDSEAISAAWMESQRIMFGDSVELQDHYRIWWSYIPHFLHSPGYVYAYAFGELLVLALYQQYRERGEAFVPLYLKLLESGGKAAPSELLRPFGVDLGDPAFWDQGLRVIEDLIDQAESLATRPTDP
ncbi:MAG: M3 family oligoendopeptidase [Syntrophobacteraceae bacterium]